MANHTGQLLILLSLKTLKILWLSEISSFLMAQKSLCYNF